MPNLLTKKPITIDPSKVRYDDELIKQIFESLAIRSMNETGEFLGLSRKYSNSASMIAAVSRVFNKVMLNPEKYGFNKEVAEQTAKIVRSRNTLQARVETNAVLKQKLIDTSGATMEELVMTNRHKAWTLLQLKLDDTLGSKKKREKISIGELAKVAGITFDKGQLVEGKATDHVAMMAKVEDSMTPEKAMDTILKMREYNNSMNNKQ